jgi:hypothetical protein
MLKFLTSGAIAIMALIKIKILSSWESGNWFLYFRKNSKILYSLSKGFSYILAIKATASLATGSSY